MTKARVNYRYECLKRSRLAQHEVLSRVLRRKISDGRWYEPDGFLKLDRHELSLALEKLRLLRERLNSEQVKLSEGETGFLAFFPEVEVGFDPRKKCHFVLL